MKCFSMLVLCLQLVVIICAVPLQMQWQSQISVQPTQEELLQEQLLALQELQQIQQMQMNQFSNYGAPPLMQKSDPPYIIIMPIEKSNSMLDNINSMFKNAIENEPKDNEVKDRITENKDLDSIVVEAVEPTPETEPKRAILLIPNRGRFSIGGLISAIPFLPIEINVPDTITWIYNGISSIISGIGQRFPFNRPLQTQMFQENMKVLLKRLQSKSQNKLTPILMMPEVAQMYPLII